MTDLVQGAPLVATGQRVVVCMLAGQEYGLHADMVHEVLQMVAVTPLSDAPDWLAGVIDLRGRIIPVIDLRLRLGLSSMTWQLSTPIIVAGFGGHVAGLVADSVVGIEAVAGAGLAGSDDSGAGTTIIRGVARIESRLLPIIDVAATCDGVGDFVRWAT